MIGILEATRINAIASNALLEEAVTQRLLDNARFVDLPVARSPRAPELIQRIVAENKLPNVDLLDSVGHSISLPWAEAVLSADSRGKTGSVQMILQLRNKEFINDEVLRRIQRDLDLDGL